MSNISLPPGMKNFNYSIKEVGKTIKASKVKHTWEVTIDNKQHIIDLFVSKLSGKIKVVKDGTTIFFEEEYDQLLSIPFHIDKHNCSLVQSGDAYEVRIDNLVFNHLMELEKSKNLFSANDPTTTTYKPNMTKVMNKPQFGIGEVRNNIDTNKKPMFNFSIKESSNQPMGNFKFNNPNDKKLYNQKDDNIDYNNVQQNNEGFKQQTQTQPDLFDLGTGNDQSGNINQVQNSQSQPFDLENIFAVNNEESKNISNIINAYEGKSEIDFSKMNQSENKSTAYDINLQSNNQQDFGFSNNQLNPQVNLIQNQNQQKKTHSDLDMFLSGMNPMNQYQQQFQQYQQYNQYQYQSQQQFNQYPQQFGGIQVNQYQQPINSQPINTQPNYQQNNFQQPQPSSIQIDFVDQGYKPKEKKPQNTEILDDFF